MRGALAAANGSADGPAADADDPPKSYGGGSSAWGGGVASGCADVPWYDAAVGADGRTRGVLSELP